MSRIQSVACEASLLIQTCCDYVTWLNCLHVCMSEIAKETYSGPAMQLICLYSY